MSEDGPEISGDRRARGRARLGRDMPLWRSRMSLESQTDEIEGLNPDVQADFVQASHRPSRIPGNQMFRGRQLRLLFLHRRSAVLS